MPPSMAAGINGEKLDRIDAKIDAMSELLTRLCEQGAQRQKIIEDHEARLRVLEKCMETLSSRISTLSSKITILTGILTFFGVTGGGYLITQAFKVLFP